MQSDNRNHNGNRTGGNHQNDRDRNFGRPTFRAKGVVIEVSQIEKSVAGNREMFVAEVNVGDISYSFPVCRNTKVGDVLVIKIDIIKVNRG